MNKVAGCVVWYNPKVDTLKNLIPLMDCLDCIYIIDNSTKLSFNVPESSKIKYISNGENLGIAKALNIAAEAAINDGYKWLLTMDQDSLFETKELKKLIKKIKTASDNVGIICPYHLITTSEPKPVKLVEQRLEVMTSGSLTNLEIFKKIGGFKDWLFIDNVDIEYCLNLNKHGYKVIRFNDIYLHHNLGDPECHRLLNKKIVCSNHNYIRRYYITRNILYTIHMYKNDFPDYCKFLKKCLNYNFKTVLLFEKDKFKKIRNMFRGYRDFKRGIKGKYNYNN